MDDYLATTSLSLVWTLAGSEQRHELADALFGLGKAKVKHHTVTVTNVSNI